LWLLVAVVVAHQMLLGVAVLEDLEPEHHLA
jgi:hypothetical protein